MEPKQELISKIDNRILRSKKLGVNEIICKSGKDRKIIIKQNTANKYTIRKELISGVEYNINDHPVELVIETFTGTRIEVTAVQMDIFDARKFLKEWKRNTSIEDCPSFGLAHVEAIEKWGGIGRKNELEPKHVQDAFQEYYKLQEEIDNGLFFDKNRQESN